jgi:hypothetical protein
VDLAADYVSGSPFNGSATWSNTTLAALDIIPGTYTYLVGDNQITVDIEGAGASTPEPASFLLFACGIALLAATTRQSRVH